MTTFEVMWLVFFLLIAVILISRVLIHREFFFTSRYNEEREYNIDETKLKESIGPTLEKTNFRLVKKDGNIFSAISLPTIFSFSEKIMVEYDQTSDSRFKVRFKSRCFFPLQVFDYGKNMRNSNRFFRNFESAILG